MPIPKRTAQSDTPVIISFASLKANQRKVKDLASENVVHVTENGNAAYVFCSEEIFEQEKRTAAEQAIREYQIAQIIREGHKDIEEGRITHGLDAAKARMREIWRENG